MREIWIFMNVTPITLWGVTKKLKQVLNAFDSHRFTHISKRGKKWIENHSKFCLELENGFDIRGSNAEVIKKLQKETNVKETSDDLDLYSDNCIPDVTGVCLRRRWCGEVDKDWLRKSRKKNERDEYETKLKENREKKEEAISKEQQQRIEGEAKYLRKQVSGTRLDQVLRWKADERARKAHSCLFTSSY